MDNIDTIIWDWNGTLLNDTDICIESINTLLNNRGLPLLDREKYLANFDFPVIDYYKRIGFDFSKEPFEIPAMQYIDLYTEKIRDSLLQESAIPILTFFKSKGFKQFILSASENRILEDSVSYFNITQFFDGLAGLDNHYATSKTEIGINMLKAHSINPENACLIGDTIHDFEVAQKMGCYCILVANGHQPSSKLRDTGTIVFENLDSVRGLF
jgi:phosphoglycolate phosphatase